MSSFGETVRADADRLLPLVNGRLLGSFQHGEAGRLADAMRYSLAAGGKRVRPLLCLLAAESVGGRVEDALAGALALECIHTYSLIHDDLPAMDDDDLRRGKPTCHKVFGEAHAILAGDGLLTEAFQILATVEQARPTDRLEAVSLLAEAAGWRGMVGGQALDLEGSRPPGGAAESSGLCEAGPPARSESTFGEAVVPQARSSSEAGPLARSESSEAGPPARSESPRTLEQLQLIHRLKTGALLRAALEIGGVLGGAGPAHRATLREAGALLGLAFQIQDDILDATATEAELGKRVGKDEGRGKITYPALLGLDQARAALQDATERAVCLFQSLPQPRSLVAWARYLEGRSA